MDNIEIPFKTNFIPMLIFELESLRIREANDAALDLYGYSREELLSLTVKDLRRSSRVPKFLRAIEETKSNPTASQNSGVWEHLDKKGHPIYVRVIGSFTTHKGKDCRVVFIQDVSNEYELSEKLKTERKILDEILNKLPGSFYIVNQEGRILRWNKKTETISGYAADELSNLRVFDLFPESELPDVKQAINQVFKNGFAEMESVVKTKQGDEIPFYFVASSIRYRDQDCLLGISLDISDIIEYENQLEKSLKEKETLLSEIHHRVKNNLAVVSSIMQLQAMETEDEEVQQILLETQNRIKSIALTHEQLYKEQSFSRINYGENIRQLIQNIQNSYSQMVHFNLELDEVHLNINKALPTSLLINELVTNAIVHAFDDDEHNTISISLKENGDHVQLTVQDNGKGMQGINNTEEPDSLGLQLVTVLANQIKAETNRYFDEGTVYEFQFSNTDAKGVGSTFL